MQVKCVKKGEKEDIKYRYFNRNKQAFGSEAIQKPVLVSKVLLFNVFCIPKNQLVLNGEFAY